MFSLLANRPPSFEVPVDPPVVASSLDIISLAIIIVILAFIVGNGLLLIFEANSRERIVLNCILGVFAVVVITSGVISANNKPPSPPRNPDIRYGSMQEAIEEDYGVLVTRNYNDYTVSTDQKQYECEVVELDNKRYTVYCDSRGERVALDKLLMEEDNE